MATPPVTSSISVAVLAQRIAEFNKTQPVLVSFVNETISDISELISKDPVHSLFGWCPPKNVTAIGICAPASVTPTNSYKPTTDDHTVVHVLERSGRAVTLLSNCNSAQWFGPSTQPQQGRVPDTCRRAFNLPTPPPTHTMTNFVVAAWLEVLMRHIPEANHMLHEEHRAFAQRLSWETIVRLHPAADSAGSPVTPASLAQATKALGHALDWDRFRMVISKVGGFPFGNDACSVAAWMDSGMFSRWAIDLLPPGPEAIAYLEPRVEPVAFDRLSAAVQLCQ